MITISPGHFGKGSGAVSLIDEAVEARKVAQALSRELKKLSINVHFLEDTVSKNQSQNIGYLVAAHNKTMRELDVSIHFNAVADVRAEGIGTEVLYVNPAVQPLAQQLSTAIAKAGSFKNRGAKRRTDLGFLNGTAKQALLIEVCFVNSKEDVVNYEQHFTAICAAIAQVLAGRVHIWPFSSGALTSRVLDMWADEQAIIRQLERGVADGVFQEVWLQRAKAGTLSIHDYLALSALQLKKYF
ncbi:MAG: N-acetylmuramoyl-L-alanine amidase [Solibacillus sp.]